MIATPNRRRGLAITVALLTVVLFGTAAVATAASVDAVPNDKQVSATEYGADGLASVHNPDPVAYTNLDGQVFWRGQRVRVSGLEAGEVYSVRKVTGTQTSTLARQPRADDSGVVTIETAELTDGDYFIRGAGITDERSQVFDVTTQNLQTQWSQQTVSRDGAADLQLDSNRGDYRVSVSAAGLRFADLEAVFDSDDFATNYDERRYDHAIILDVESDQARLPASFSDIRADSYDFDVDVVDSTATGTAPLSVAKTQQELRFTNRSVTQTVGDRTELTVQMANTRTAYVVVGGADDGFVDVLRLTDRSGDGTVTLGMNTRYMGLDTDDPGVSTTVRPYQATSREDTVTQLRPTNRLDSGTTVAEFRENLGVGSGLRRPLQVGTYNLTGTTAKDLAATGDGISVRYQHDTATLTLEPRELRGVQTFAAPRGSAASGDVATMRGLTQRNHIAMGDRIVVRTELNGVFGHLSEERNNQLSGILDNEAEGIDVTIEQANSDPDRSPTRFSLDRDSADLEVDEENDRLYLVVDPTTVETIRPLEAGEEYRVTFRLTGVSYLEPVYNLRSDRERAYTGYPYLEPGEERTAETTFQLHERSVNLTGLTDGRLELPPYRTVEIAGETTLSPGTSLLVRSQARGENSFLRVSSTVVQPDGTWSVNQNFETGQPGQSFTTVVRDSEGTLAEVDGRVVTPAEPEPDPEPEIPADPATFLLSGLEPGDVTVQQGETVDVSATVTNEGDVEDTQVVELRVAGDLVASEDVTLAGGASGTFDASIPTADLPVGTHSYTLRTDQQRVSATLTVEGGEADDAAEDADDDAAEDDDGQAPADEEGETGEDADGEASADEDGGTGEAADGEGPGFGIAAALLAIVAGLLLGRRRPAR